MTIFKIITLKQQLANPVIDCNLAGYSRPKVYSFLSFTEICLYAALGTETIPQSLPLQVHTGLNALTGFYIRYIWDTLLTLIIALASMKFDQS